MTPVPASAVRAYAPGRVNLIGDHTDYSGGLVLPMAIDRGTTIVFRRGGTTIELTSADEPEPCIIDLSEGPLEPSTVKPAWARYVAGVATVIAADVGGVGSVTSDLPIGAGLSSSASLEVATALALGLAGTPLVIAQACQQAEHIASGVPCGIMDQLASAAGVAGHALLIDCTSLEVVSVPVPEDVEVIVVHSGQARRLDLSAYAVRRSQVEQAATVLERPLRGVDAERLSALGDPILRKRARHVTSENQRVLDFAAALRAHDCDEAGQLMVESHRSLREDFEVSTPALDRLVDELVQTRGVFGARLTGAGFGGCVVALARAGTGEAIRRGWVVRPAAGASVVPLE